MPRLESNPRRRNSDVIDDAAATGMQIYGDIWALPSAVLERTIKTGLQFKDALKHGAKHVIRRNSVTWEDDESDVRRDLLFAASRSRSAEELARIHKWAIAKRDNELRQVVETRAGELRIPLSKLKESQGWGWNPKITDRAFRYREARTNPDEAAAEAYRRFHGRPADKEIVIEEEVHYHKRLATIGVLAACVIDTPTGLQATINFDSEDGRPVPWLCMSEDGCQLFIEGGDQSIDLKSLEMDGKDWYKERMVLGTFAEPESGRRFNIAYITEKRFDDFEVIRYEHDLGEPDEGEPKSHRREAPTLEFEPINKKLFICGGQYKISLPVFSVSPGIEN